MRLRLRFILFIGFTLISAVPVLLLSAWVQDAALDKQDAALDKEVDSVREKHLIVAHNLTGALARYVIDVEGGFRLAVTASMSEPFTLVGREVFIGASTGITVFPNDAIDPIAMLRNADVAMYQAKDAGRAGFKFYATEMNAFALERLDLESELRRALERDEFVLHHQPIIDLASGRIIGAEALIRWNHPEKGMVAPGEFIPLAEDTGLIVPLGAWVLRKACEEACGWTGQPYVSVNLSNRQLSNGLAPEDVAKVLGETGLAPNRLIFEITESLIMENTDSVIAWLKAVREMGVRISIDDFGTGYSSLSYL